MDPAFAALFTAKLHAEQAQLATHRQSLERLTSSLDHLGHAQAEHHDMAAHRSGVAAAWSLFSQERRKTLLAQMALVRADVEEQKLRAQLALAQRDAVCSLVEADRTHRRRAARRRDQDHLDEIIATAAIRHPDGQYR